MSSPRPTSVAHPERDGWGVGNPWDIRLVFLRRGTCCMGLSGTCRIFNYLAVTNLTPVTFLTYYVDNTHARRDTAPPHCITHVQTAPRRAAVPPVWALAPPLPGVIALLALLCTASSSPLCVCSRWQPLLLWPPAGPGWCFRIANWIMLALQLLRQIWLPRLSYILPVRFLLWSYFSFLQLHRVTETPQTLLWHLSPLWHRYQCLANTHG